MAYRKIMNNVELVDKCKNIADNYKTIYIMGCFGAPLTKENKKRYTNNHSFNKQAGRTNAINDASEDTFGFDCLGLVEAIVWGWRGDTNAAYGGAAYQSNGINDHSANGVINICEDVSDDFSNVMPGELLWKQGHVGVYIGNGVAIESTPNWEDGVQYSKVLNIGKYSGATRRWTKHGKLPWIEYIKKPVVKIPDIIYSVRAGCSWLPEVKNMDDFAGIENRQITGVMIKLSDGTPIKYRVHIKGGKWLPYVTGYDKQDTKNGYAGNSKVIDAIEILCDKYKIAYKVSSTANGKAYYSEVIDGEDYAGVFGRAVDKLQCRIVK